MHKRRFNILFIIDLDMFRYKKNHPVLNTLLNKQDIKKENMEISINI
jgi:hypothetical protein